MKLNHILTVSSIWNEQEQVNKTNVDFEQKTTPIHALTILEMAKQAIEDSIENHIKQNYSNGKCSEEEFEKIMITNFSKL